MSAVSCVRLATHTHTHTHTNYSHKPLHTQEIPTCRAALRGVLCGGGGKEPEIYTYKKDLKKYIGKSAVSFMEKKTSQKKIHKIYKKI